MYAVAIEMMKWLQTATNCYKLLSTTKGPIMKWEPILRMFLDYQNGLKQW
jgi:hypothetical protein